MLRLPPPHPTPSLWNIPKTGVRVVAVTKDVRCVNSSPIVLCTICLPAVLFRDSWASDNAQEIVTLSSFRMGMMVDAVQ